ncbi:MAG: hypothetical protein J5659_00040 [Clostridia bacterium]|nr:hypothetical protein [Clostridia bacterium]
MNLTKKQKRFLFGKSMSLTALALLIILTVVVGSIISLGWFANRDTADANGVSVTAKEERFELAVSGEQVLPFANDSTIITYLNSVAGGSYEKRASTEREHTSILCRVINEKPHIAGSDELAPGAFGRISFDIVLQAGDPVRDYEISLDYLPLDLVAGVPQAVDNADIDDLKDLISGHILLFNTRSALINGGYYYSDRITNKRFVFSPSEHTPSVESDGIHYTVEFYFIWPATFAQLALKQDSPKLHLHPVFQTEALRLEMLNYIIENQDEFFRNLGQGINFSAESFEETFFVELSDGYNTADQFIGDKAHFLVICSTVNPV